MKKQVKKGSIYTVEFQPNEKEPNRPVGRIFSWICFIHKSDMNYPQAGEVWRVEVFIVKTNYLVIKPISLVYTKEQNEALKYNKLLKLKAKNEGTV